MHSVIVEVQNEWQRLVDQRNGFLIEDKGLAVALHARWAKREEASSVLEAAKHTANRLIDPQRHRLLDGDRFLEVAPITANKGLTVRWFLAEYKFQDDLPVYFGDDNKDEEAFEVIREHGGLSIGVGDNYPLLKADEHIPSPDIVRSWLNAISSAH